MYVEVDVISHSSSSWSGKSLKSLILCEYGPGMKKEKLNVHNNFLFL